MSDRDAALLKRAFAEARRADWLHTAPNPRVGALALLGGHVVGYGYHARWGGQHAEEAALRDAGAWDEQAGAWRSDCVDEMYVTLEPCSSTGPGKKRPPCLQALLDCGVKRLVVATADSYPAHGGAGLKAFQKAGGELVVLDGGSHFAAQNRAFGRALAHPDRPWVLAKWASSVDGKIATDDGVSQWISGPESRAEVHALRAESSAVLTGAGTLLTDDPQMDARPVDLAPDQRHQPQPLRVFLLPQQLPANFAPQTLQVDGPRLWVHGQGSALPTSIAGSSDPTLELPRDGRGLDLVMLLQTLRSDYGVRRLLVEGGARLHGALADRGLLDAIVRYEAPILLGGHRAACAGDGADGPQTALRLLDEERLDLGADLRRAFLVEEA